MMFKIFLKFLKFKPIFNVYKKKYKKKALLSYITYPFRIKKCHYYKHTNYYEAWTWAKILDELGYKVDVINYNFFPPFWDITKYDVICGFGEAFKIHIMTPNSHAKTIFYATGMENTVQNYMTLKRINDVYKRKKVWLGKSSRFVEKYYTVLTTICDAVVALGNEVCANSYKNYCDRVYSLPAPFCKVIDFREIINNKYKNAKYHFLWFGSVGAIHKGLDLLLEIFYKRKNLCLHICGPINNEKDFCQVFKKELESSNVYIHNFISIKSKKFKELLKQCAWIIFPSASEGGGASVITCMGNGGLLPIISKETTVDDPCAIWIKDLTIQSLEEAIEKALSLSFDEIKERSLEIGFRITAKHSLENYYLNLKTILKQEL